MHHLKLYLRGYNTRNTTFKSSLNHPFLWVLNQELNCAIAAVRRPVGKGGEAILKILVFENVVYLFFSLRRSLVCWLSLVYTKQPARNMWEHLSITCRSLMTRNYTQKHKVDPVEIITCSRLAWSDNMSGDWVMNGPKWRTTLQLNVVRNRDA